MQEKTINNKIFQESTNDDSISEINVDNLTIVIPVLNEEKAIGQVIDEIKKEGYEKILVVDGYSTDNTVSIASRNDVEVIFQHGVGKTGAIKTAIEHVKTPYFVVMDGDCSYDPKDIINFFYHIQEYDEIIGVRSTGKQNIPLLNRFGNWMINFTFNLLFGTNLIDVCSGMYMLKTNFAKQLSLETQGFDVEVEVAAQTATEGKITQVPISYKQRVGKQKLRPFRHGVQIMSTVWKLARSYNPVFLFSALAALSIIPGIIILSWVALEWYHRIWHNELAMLGLILMLFSLLTFILSTISTLLKRMERRIIRKIINYT